MSISKLRGKSALGRSNCENTTTSHSTNLAANKNNNNNNSNNKLTKSSYIPQTSLLKIEPFVPSLNARLRRPIHRSYSTLSSSYFRKLTNQQNHHRLNGPNSDVLRARGKEVTSFQRQRSKSTGSSSSVVVNSTAKSTIVTQQPNGVCRIVRSPKEQEKLPDRINYDRRGLGAIPIFENEPNLRLLSLQHNLINVFHIPQQGGGDGGSVAVVDNQQQTQQPPNYEASKPDKVPNNKTISKAKLLNNPRNSISKRSSSPLVTVGPPNPLQARFSPSSQGSEGTNSNRLLIKNSIILNTSTNTMNTIKKSKSFISNYSKHLSSLKKNLHSKCSMVPAMVTNVRQSPGSLDVSPCESPVDVLNVKNNQLLASYGEIFQNLVFLDLYDNQIEKISNLDGLTNLTVLLLGKNRISEMTGLASLRNTLRVLDLHGNRITSIGNKINCLQELKSLNLAGNQIRQINHNDFMGLMNLRELNLKRNKIKRVNGFNHLTSLERLWLCHNDLHKVEDMSSIAKAINLLEVTIENNPVSLAGDCVSFLVSYLPKLLMLSQMPITEQVRRAAMAWRRNKELSDSSYSTLSSDVFSSIRREEVISNARTNWELLRSQQTYHRNLMTSEATSSPDVVPPSQEIAPSPMIVAEIQQEAVKLPPIQGQNPNPFGSNAPSEKTHSSASSLGPNVDSSSSYFSSDNEDRDMSRRPKGKPHHRDNAHEDLKGPHSTMNKETNEDDNMPTKHEETVVEKTIDPALTIGTDSPPTTNTNTTIQNPSVTIVSQSTATTINNDSSAMNPEKSSSSSSLALGTGTAVAEAAAPSKSQHQQQHRNPTMSLAINGNNNPGITSNPNVTTKRYMHGSLMRSQTTKPTSSLAAATAPGATATATAPAGNVAAAAAATNRASAQLSHHNSTANNGVATSGSGNGLGNGGSAGSYSNSSGTAGGVTSSCNNGSSNAAANKTSTTIAASSASTSTSTPAVGATTAKQAVEREREQGGDYLIEICGRYLNVYGTGALRFIDKQWSAQKAGDVHTLNFSYINFNSITAVLGRVKARFPHAEHFVFRETNISCLGQLNAMAELQGITSLTIDSEGNPICGKDWRLYAIYRLSHWGLKTINGQDVSEDDMTAAQQVYVGLSDLVLWSMPDGMLQPLLGRLRLEENCSSSKLTPKEWLLKADNALKVVVGKEALQWKKTASGASGELESTTTRERGRMHFSLMIENTCNAVEKLNLLEELWPSLLLDIVRNTLLDYSQLDVYLKNLMAEIMK